MAYAADLSLFKGTAGLRDLSSQRPLRGRPWFNEVTCSEQFNPRCINPSRVARRSILADQPLFDSGLALLEGIPLIEGRMGFGQIDLRTDLLERSQRCPADDPPILPS